MTGPKEQVPNPGTLRGAEAVWTASAGSQILQVKRDSSLLPVPREDRAALLDRLVRGEILPRLAVAHAVPIALVPVREPVVVTTDNDTRALVSILLTRSAEDAIRFVEGFRQRGVAVGVLYLGIVTDAARRLGTLWADDLCGFTDVTIGLGHLQQVVRFLSPSFQQDSLLRPRTETILLVPAPAEQHTFGLVLLSEFFRRDGWHVYGGPKTGGDEAVCMARDTWMDVAGFSIGSHHLLDGLTACIAAVRRASMNQAISVMVGGPMLQTHPDLARLTGADTAAFDAPGAVREARALLSFRAAAD